jgi:hypothetical protein
MKKITLFKSALASLLVCAALLSGPTDAYSEFSVDWGTSLDNGQTGDRNIAQWLVGNGYYNNLSDAQNFAQTGYIGYNQGDADPFYWQTEQPVSAQIVQELAGYADLNTFGYYTGSGNSKNLNQILSGTENGPVIFSVSQPFGFYLSTPEQNLWFTDRAENGQQSGALKKLGGNAQGLIYELVPNQEWLLAWEDLDATKIISDRDYNDMYVKITVAPEPVSSVLFVIGSGVMAAAVRFRMKKA